MFNHNIRNDCMNKIQLKKEKVSIKIRNNEKYIL